MFGLSKRKPRQPDMEFAADAFSPIAAMRLHGVKLDFAAANDAHTASVIAKGCTADQARSSHWGGMSAIVQDAAVFAYNVAAFESAADEAGIVHTTARGTELKLRSAATLTLAMALAEAPDDYERYLRHLNV